jgi:hypothetical protein
LSGLSKRNRIHRPKDVSEQRITRCHHRERRYVFSSYKQFETTGAISCVSDFISTHHISHCAFFCEFMATNLLSHTLTYRHAVRRETKVPHIYRLPVKFREFLSHRSRTNNASDFSYCFYSQVKLYSFIYNAYSEYSIHR